jgi:hypothetical protein
MGGTDHLWPFGSLLLLAERYPGRGESKQGVKEMPPKEVFVILDIGQGHQIHSGVVGHLIHENGHPFALLSPGRAASLPEKVSLVGTQLRKQRDASPGVPELWAHPLVAIP